MPQDIWSAIKIAFGLGIGWTIGVALMSTVISFLQNSLRKQ